MKIETTVLLFCFLSGIFLTVIYAKPSPELMKELIALEKYLEKKEGSDGAVGQNENQDEQKSDLKPIDDLFGEKLGENNENQKTDAQDKPMNENNDKGDDSSNKEGPSDDEKPTEQGGAAPPAKPEGGVQSGKGDEVPSGDEKPTEQDGAAPPETTEEKLPSVNAEESSGDQGPSGGEGEGEKPQESKNQEGQGEAGRDSIFNAFDKSINDLKNVLDNLLSLGDKFRKLFQKDDNKFSELEDKDEQTKEETKQKLEKLINLVNEIKSIFGVKEAPAKKSVRENIPARRSQLSDTEFLNIVQSLLANN